MPDERAVPKWRGGIKFTRHMRDLSNKRQGRLVIIRPRGKTRMGHVLWECLCDCGVRKDIPSHSLLRTNGGTKSCGCLRREVSSRPKSWNTGKTYAIQNGERVYTTRHAWAKAVIRVQGNKCRICGWAEGRCDVDHITSRRNGGPHTIRNGQVLCPNHHRVKHEAK